MSKPTPAHDPVNRPKHYLQHPSGIECITITRHMSFNLGNAVKYLWRDGLKDDTPSNQDLEKAIWYIKDEIKRRERQELDETNRQFHFEEESEESQGASV